MKSYAQAAKLGNKGNKNKQVPSSYARPTPQTEPPKQEATPTVAAMRAKLAALKTARDACLLADSQSAQAIEEEIASTTRILHGAKPAGEQLDGLKAAVARAEKRLHKATQDLDDAQARIEAESAAITAYKSDLAELESNLAKQAAPSGVDPIPQPRPWVAASLKDAAAHIRAGSDFQREALASYLEGLVVPLMPTLAPTAPQEPQAENNGKDEDMSATPQLKRDQDVLADATNLFTETKGPWEKRRATGKTFVETPQPDQLDVP